jgi:uncharacterized protein YjbJ (UPF0337 family)
MMSANSLRNSAVWLNPRSEVATREGKRKSVMDNERLAGLEHQVKGALKEGLGKILGDAKLVTDGAAERTAGEPVNYGDAAGARIFDVDADRVKGVGHQLKGALKQSLGILVGNPKLEADGIAESREGQTQNAAGSARDEKREAFARKSTAVDAVGEAEIEKRMERELAAKKQKELDSANSAKGEPVIFGRFMRSIPEAEKRD